ncbi:DUF1659 domain-containing protein [Clostridium paraputrificum]|uniref:DUF1659 domain-containing protein n=1 Tax=Clostridium paraputrificum TaxID=29363 RepID=UPI003D33916C
MAINKIISSSSLVMEIETGQDKDGKATYKKKTFNGVKTNAAIDDVYAVADAITKVLANDTRDFFLKESSKIESQA